ncbi:hypothetical protein ONZ45_g11059 [Pleurotus djamor]|nr:hypothetical protein ONZ45_g11059 [Pleurotus djamor]
MDAVSGFFLHDDKEATVSETADMVREFIMLPKPSTRHPYEKGKLNSTGAVATLLNFCDSHWAKLNGDDELPSAPDAELTPLGFSQAETAKVAWEAELPNGLRVPGTVYVSPHRRAFNTWQTTFSGNNNLKKSGLVMEVSTLVEDDSASMRAAKAFITSAFPRGVVKEGFTDGDEIWKTDLRETTRQSQRHNVYMEEWHQFAQKYGVNYAVSENRSVDGCILLLLAELRQTEAFCHQVRIWAIPRLRLASHGLYVERLLRKLFSNEVLTFVWSLVRREQSKGSRLSRKSASTQ